MKKTERTKHVSNINRYFRQELKTIPGILVLREVEGTVQVAIQVLQKRYIFDTDIRADFSGCVLVDLGQFLQLFKGSEIVRIEAGSKVEFHTKTGVHYLIQEVLDFEQMTGVYDMTGFEAVTELQADQLNSLRPYLSTDDLRPALTGVFLGNRRGSGYLCGTDGHILKHIEQPQLPENFGEIVIPAEAVSCAPKIGSVALRQDTANKGTYLLDCGTHSVVFEAIPEKYPDFLAVIPGQFIPAAELDKNKFLEALKIAQNINSHTKQFRLFSRGASMYLRAEDLDSGQEFESLPIGTALHENYEQGFNGKLFETVLKDTAGDIVRLRFTGHKARAASVGFDSVRIIMPVYLGSYA